MFETITEFLTGGSKSVESPAVTLEFLKDRRMGIVDFSESFLRTVLQTIDTPLIAPTNLPEQPNIDFNRPHGMNTVPAKTKQAGLVAPASVEKAPVPVESELTEDSIMAKLDSLYASQQPTFTSDDEQILRS